jgi:hypothetical protein
MKCYSFTIMLTIVLGSISADMIHAKETFPPKRKAVECTPRAGLPNFFAKAAAGGEYTVAYFGGSITAQNGYRVKSLAYLNKKYPNCTFREINAAIGGTGSDLGVLRIDHDVFPGKPDLLIVEFAVNDWERNPEEIVRSMEGIVRKTWKKYPACDILFVYTFTTRLLNDLQAGRFNRSAAVMEVIADHYGIPTIHLGLEAVRLEKEGKLIMKVPNAKMEQVTGSELSKITKSAIDANGKIPFAKDGVHPYENTGHQLYQEAIERSIPVIQKASGPAGTHTLPAPLDPKNYEKSTMVDIDDVAKEGPWEKLPVSVEFCKRFRKHVNSLWKAQPGATLSFSFKGTAVMVYDLLGPDCGKLEITLDGKKSKNLRFDMFCEYYRLALLKIGNNLEDTVHTVQIKVLNDKFDKAAILNKRSPGLMKKDPKRFKGHNWYPGAIFIIGEMRK